MYVWYIFNGVYLFICLTVSLNPALTARLEDGCGTMLAVSWSQASQALVALNETIMQNSGVFLVICNKLPSRKNEQCYKVAAAATLVLVLWLMISASVITTKEMEQENCAAQRRYRMFSLSFTDRQCFQLSGLLGVDITFKGTAKQCCNICMK